MSQWTHVSGSIRVDGMPQIGMLIPRWPLVLGRQSTRIYDGVGQTYDSGGPASEIPKGSEGTLQYEVIEAGHGLVWKTIAVWGDLRDYGEDPERDIQHIQDWLQRVIGRLPMIRSAELVVSIEYGVTVLLWADDLVVRRVTLKEKS